MRALLARTRPATVAALVVLAAAVPFALAGLLHGRLFHQGFAETGLIGILFLANAIATGAAVVVLLFGRVRLFLLAVLAISLPSIIAIVLSHSAIGLFGLREGEWTGDAVLIIACELIASALALVAVALGAWRDRGEELRASRPFSSVAAAVVAVLFALVVVGVGQGEPPEEHVELSAAVVEAARANVAAGGPEVAAGEELFASEGCSKCHAISAGDYDGRLGPQLDVEESGESPDDVIGSIVDRDENSLMRTDYDEILSDPEARALAAYVSASAVPDDAEEPEDSEDSDED